MLYSSVSDDANEVEAAVLQKYLGLTDELLVHLRQVYAHVNSDLDNYTSNSQSVARTSSVKKLISAMSACLRHRFRAVQIP